MRGVREAPALIRPPGGLYCPPAAEAGQHLQPRCLSQSQGGLSRAGGGARAASGGSSDGHTASPLPCPDLLPLRCPHVTHLEAHLHVSHSPSQQRLLQPQRSVILKLRDPELDWPRKKRGDTMSKTRSERGAITTSHNDKDYKEIFRTVYQ